MHNKTLRLGIILLLLFSMLFLLNYLKLTGYAPLNQTQRLLVNMDISPDQLKIIPGQTILLQVTIREVGNGNNEITSIDLDYAIKDLQGNIISSKKESGSIAVKQSDTTGLLIPTSTKPGIYVANVIVNYKNSNYIGSKTFEVIPSDNKGVNIDNKSLTILGVILVIGLIIIIIFLIKGRFLPKEKEEKERKFFRHRKKRRTRKRKRRR